MRTNILNWKVVIICCVASLCEGVDFNQWLPLQCKFCMNTNGVSSLSLHFFYCFYFYFWVFVVNLAFVLTSTIQFQFWTLFDFKARLFACV